MGLFGKLFEKKECAVCGGEIGLLGNRKLEDGNLCKNCAGKLSYWFDDRRHSTVEEIKAQLAYREENQRNLQNFHVTRTFGDRYLICIDEDNRKFLIQRTKDFRAENSDIIDFSQVTSCDLDIDESSREDMREEKDAEGKTKKVSYVPPRFIYSYDFTVKLRVNHPYFDSLNIRLNNDSIEIVENGKRTGITAVRKPALQSAAYRDYMMMGNEIKSMLMNRQPAQAATAPANDSANASSENRPQSSEPAFTASAAKTEAQQEAAGQAGGTVVCPYCGGTVPAGTTCPLCDAPLN